MLEHEKPYASVRVLGGRDRVNTGHAQDLGASTLVLKFSMARLGKFLLLQRDPGG